MAALCSLSYWGGRGARARTGDGQNPSPFQVELRPNVDTELSGFEPTTSFLP